MVDLDTMSLNLYTNILGIHPNVLNLDKVITVEMCNENPIHPRRRQHTSSGGS